MAPWKLHNSLSSVGGYRNDGLIKHTHTKKKKKKHKMYHPSDRVPKIAIYNFQKPSLSQLCFIAMYQGQMI